MYFWLSMVKQARYGSKDAMDMLASENQNRAKQNRPSVQEELLEIADLLEATSSDTKKGKPCL